ncbi:triose-phosphate isomerase [uncultured Draconibacterium sp.]|uniref:triose-phosphate isomerase n=1 Tax=uncultured Draconibacterium sp. TaxID=1573823 RepID=UPI0029BFF33E|nr:triose-phosphate isomerase [uncultured Draconibacterium sp.]
MRQKIVAGNWKCNTNLQEGVELAKAVDAIVASEGAEDVVVVLGAPFTHITKVVDTVNTERIGVAAQNCAAEAKGAYTGEVSAEMVKSTGAEYVILGHSERREYYGETSEILNKKVALALENELTPIYCCGEALDIREAGTHNEYVVNQLEETVFQLSADDFKKIVIAYEPIWAIGTGVTASSEQAQDMHANIRAAITAKFGEEVAEGTSILYGGSCKPSNAKELFANKDVDGGLIGGAALKAEDFIGIINGF